MLVDSRTERSPQLLAPVDDQIRQLLVGAAWVRVPADDADSCQLGQDDAAWVVDVSSGWRQTGTQVQHTDRCSLQVQRRTALLQRRVDRLTNVFLHMDTQTAAACMG